MGAYGKYEHLELKFRHFKNKKFALFNTIPLLAFPTLFIAVGNEHNIQTCFLVENFPDVESEYQI